MYPFERFTERAKKVLTLSQEEAERSHHSYIGTEHMLLGLLRVSDGLAARALTSLGVGIDGVRSTIESVLGRNDRIRIQQIIPTSRVKTVIETSFEEARRMGNDYVGTEHLLLGLLIEGEGIAAHVLHDLGATLAAVRAELDRMMQAGERDPEDVSVAQHLAERIPGGPTALRHFAGPRPRSQVDPIQLAAERLAAEQHTTVGVEHAVLAAIDADPLVRRMLAALGIDEAKLVELRRIATPPAELVEMRAALARAGGKERRPVEADIDELRQLRGRLEEAERRWRAGEEIEGPDPSGGANRGS